MLSLPTNQVTDVELTGTGYIRPGTGKGVWLGVLANV